MTTFALDPGPVVDVYARACDRLEAMHAAAGLWGENLDLWSQDPGIRRAIANRLGWLRALDAVEPELGRVKAFAQAIRRDGYERVVLMGMGGSSLAPEVLRRVLGVAPGFPRFVMVDTVNPDAVRAVFAERSRTLHLLASKSGTTIEPMSLAAEAKHVAMTEGGWGMHAAAITDRDTALHHQARDEGFRETFINPSTIGGRYSALSLFGLVPAALMGADLDGLVASGRRMTAECQRPEPRDNPGLALGAFMAAAAEAGRDKLTLLLPPSFESFGLWVEQLVAESTGKHGCGVVPIAAEGPTAHYGDDRAFVVVSFRGAGPDAGLVARARASGAPVVSIDVPEPSDVAAEFLRWEVATAIAGLLLGVNPFDEPNVKQAKDATRRLLDAYRAEGALPVPDTHAVLGEVQLTLSSALPGSGSDSWAATIGSLESRDYLALLAYAPTDDTAFGAALERLRARLGAAGRVATTLGYGPRYLHSTGQLHKGGPNTGVFVIVVTRPEQDLPIPGEPFSFGLLEAAQALGDFRALQEGARRVAYLRLPRRDPNLLDEVAEAMTRARREQGPRP